MAFLYSDWLYFVWHGINNDDRVILNSHIIVFERWHYNANDWCLQCTREKRGASRQKRDSSREKRDGVDLHLSGTVSMYDAVKYRFSLISQFSQKNISRRN